MLLCVDVGNSSTVLGLFDADTLVRHWRVSTSENRSSDEWRLLVDGLLGPLGDNLDGIAVCSTVPVVLQEIREMLRTHHGHLSCLVVEPGVRTGVPVQMDNPREVGTDRILNALAAIRLHGAPCIVVDFGTATTYDVVSPRGEYVGGAIAPGIGLSLEALGRAGAQLRRVELLRPRSVVAKNTVEALQSGAVFGFAGQVEGLVTRMVDELGLVRDDVTVVATGGLAAVVVEECTVIDVHDPWLTLHGLRLAYARNGGNLAGTGPG
jgi:type III pantothenate kinase